MKSSAYLKRLMWVYSKHEKGTPAELQRYSMYINANAIFYYLFVHNRHVSALSKAPQKNPCKFEGINT